MPKTSLQFGLLLAIFIAFVQTSFANIKPMNLDELVKDSKTIFVGTVISKQSRWNDKGNLIVTDVEFRVDELLHGEPGMVARYTFAGGELDGLVDNLTVVPKFHKGDSMMVMIDKNHQFQFSATVGGWQGVFKESHFKEAGRSKSTDGFSVDRVSFDDFKGIVRNQLAFSGRGRQKMSAGLPVNLKFRELGAMLSHEQCSCSSTRQKGGNGRQAFKTFARLAQVPVSINPRPDSDTRMGGRDKKMLEEWNRYADVFEVETSSGSWAWSNSIFDIAGFVDSETMQNIFGQGWGNSLGVTFTRTNGAGIIMEADVFLNPNARWSTNNEEIPFRPNYYGIDLTLIHEFGHILGLDHDFTGLSVMNYAPQKFDGEYMLRETDIAAIRSLYPAAMKDVNDIGIYLYKSSGYRYYSNAKVSRDGNEVSEVSAGEELVVSDYTVEYIGEEPAGIVNLQWYLSKSYQNLDQVYEIGTTQHRALTSGSSKSSSPLVIPDSVEPGDYHLVVRIADGQDGLDVNNTSWLLKSISVDNPNFSGTTTQTSLANNEVTFVQTAGGGGGGGGCLMKRQ